jgi:dTDP-4-dehydrorhamnose reductase
MRVLVTGAAGLVGSRAARAARARGHDAHLAYHEAPLAGLEGPWHRLDRASAGDAGRVLGELKPAWVLDCAAYTDVDGCERDPSRAMAVNAQGTRRLAEAAAHVGARVVHVSTDFVFRGDLARPHTEEDEPAPQSAYARSKLAGEEAVLAHPGCAVVRASVVYGWHPRKRSFPAWVVGELRAGRRIRVARDQRSSPTHAGSLAEFLVMVAERGARGLYHAAGADCVTRLAFAQEAARVFGLDAALLEPVASRDLSLLAPRPSNGCLDSAKAAREIGYVPLEVRDGLERMREEEALAGTRPARP